MSYFVLSADFNHDGWLDLLDVAYNYDDKPETLANSSVLFFGSPAGFSSQRSTVLPTYCSGNARPADVNRDGWLDVIFYNPRGFISIYLGGTQGFSPERMWKTPLDAGKNCVVPSINCADLNEDGWLDLIVSVMGHYTRQPSGFFLLYGGPDGFTKEQTQFHRTEASSILISAADINNDGHLDLLVPAYSTQVTRTLPAHIFWGNGKTFDFERPFVIPCDASCAFAALNISETGYRDLLAVCHRDDLGHQVDSLLFWNGQQGLSLDRVARLQGLGPHLCSPRDFGNAYTREPLENYISPAYDTAGLRPLKLTWIAEVPEKTQLKFQLRWSDTKDGLQNAAWRGPDGTGTFYETSGQGIGGTEKPARWLQYKAVFVSINGCRSPKLEEVRVDLVPSDASLDIAH
jgi:hypothetical protein